VAHYQLLKDVLCRYKEGFPLRDFNCGGDMNIGGDLNIADSSHNEHKLLFQCSTEELLVERPFRQGNIKLEQKRKLKLFLPVVGVAVVLFICAAFWALIKGKPDLGSFVLGAGSLFLTYASIQAALQPNAFQKHEQTAIDEINMILKSRRVE
jgi:hypothetical protein